MKFQNLEYFFLANLKTKQNSNTYHSVKMIWKHNLFSFSVLEYNVLYLVEKSGNLKLARKLPKEKPEAILYLSVTSLGYLKAFLELYGQLWLNLVWKAESGSWLIMNQKKITDVFRSREKINYNEKIVSVSFRKDECFRPVFQCFRQLSFLWAYWWLWGLSFCCIMKELGFL